MFVLHVVICSPWENRDLLTPQCVGASYQTVQCPCQGWCCCSVCRTVDVCNTQELYSHSALGADLAVLTGFDLWFALHSSNAVLFVDNTWPWNFKCYCSQDKILHSEWPLEMTPYLCDSTALEGSLHGCWKSVAELSSLIKDLFGPLGTYRQLRVNKMVWGNSLPSYIWTWERKYNGEACDSRKGQGEITPWLQSWVEQTRQN